MEKLTRKTETKIRIPFQTVTRNVQCSYRNVRTGRDRLGQAGIGRDRVD